MSLRGRLPKIGARLPIGVLVERPSVLKPGKPLDLARLHAVAVLLIGREVRQAVLIAPEVINLAADVPPVENELTR